MTEPLVVLRLRRCVFRGCGVLFWICRSCDRGQRFCCQDCRRSERLLQRREANRRHQQSPEGRADHRDRQRAYRERLRARVTDQGRRRPRSPVNLPHQRLARPPIPAGPAEARVEVRHEQAFCGFRRRPAPVCSRCGRPGRLVDPFERG